MILPVQDRGQVWRDGELIPFAEATTHVLSHMSARGSQVFDVLLVTRTDTGPCGVGLRQHVARFVRSAELMGMEDVGQVGDLEGAVARVVGANVARHRRGAVPRQADRRLGRGGRRGAPGVAAPDRLRGHHAADRR